MSLMLTYLTFSRSKVHYRFFDLVTFETQHIIHLYKITFLAFTYYEKLTSYPKGYKLPAH